jgi:hypothetical protein
MHLYELAEAYKTLSVLALDDENFDVETLKTELAKVTTEFNDKAENIAKLYLQLESDETACKNEIDRLSKRHKSANTKKEWLKAYLLNELQNAKIDKVKGSVVSISLRKSPKPTVNILDATKIPHELCKYVPEAYVPDKELILKHAETTGEVVEGVEVITDKKYVVIK